MPCPPLPPGHSRTSGCQPNPVLASGTLLLWCCCALFGAAETARAQEPQFSLFPPSALWEERFESSEAYPYSDPVKQSIYGLPDRHDERRLDRDERALAHPFARSNNFDWIEKSRLHRPRRYQSDAYGYFIDPVPSYQVYSRQQHHGRIQGAENFGALSSPVGFGHGGFQSYFSQSTYGFDGNRTPNFELGPFSATLTGTASSEWIDRLPTTVAADTGADPEDDLFIVSGGIDLAAQLQISERSAIDLQLGAGIDYYPDGRPGSGDREDHFVDFQVLPNTYATYGFGVGEAEVSVYDRFARFRNRAYSYYSLDPLDYADYQEHALGATVHIPLNDRVSTDTGYEFNQLDSLSEGGELLDRTTHSVFGTIAYSPEGNWEVGVQTSGSEFDYDLAERADGSSFTAGVFGNYPLSDYTRFSATAGFHSFDFDEVEAPGALADSSSLDNGYWSLSIENDLNDRMTHSVTVGSGAAIGVSSNYVESTQAGYELQYRIFDSTVVTGGINFLNSSESGGEFPEDIDSIHYHVGVRHQLTDHTSLGISFSQHNSESDLDDRDYDQTRLQAYCAIDLNDKLELRASYQRWDVDSTNDIGGFTQNSATIGFTLKF